MPERRVRYYRTFTLHEHVCVQSDGTGTFLSDLFSYQGLIFSEYFLASSFPFFVKFQLNN